jgi:hypothetical protein
LEFHAYCRSQQMQPSEFKLHPPYPLIRMAYLASNANSELP